MFRQYQSPTVQAAIVIFSLGTLLARSKVTYPDHFPNQGPCSEMISANSLVYFAKDVSSVIWFYAFKVRLGESPFVEYAVEDGESNYSLLYLLSFFWIWWQLSVLYVGEYRDRPTSVVLDKESSNFFYAWVLLNFNLLGWMFHPILRWCALCHFICLCILVSWYYCEFYLFEITRHLICELHVFLHLGFLRLILVVDRFIVGCKKLELYSIFQNAVI